MNKEYLIPCNICGHFCLAGRPCYDIFTGIPRDWEELRLSWIKDLLRMGKLTDHDQSTDDSEQWYHLSVPDFKLLSNSYIKYQNFSKYLPLPLPQWFEHACEEMECEGGSPYGMQTAVLDELQQN